jgi:IclR family transcriptional regulator, KDG regulon repressor
MLANDNQRHHNMAEERSDGGVRSVQLALDVLETVAFANEELGVTQVADRLGITKGSVHRHLLTLVDRGYLVQNPVTSRYSIGPKSRLLARLAPDADLAQVAEGPMRELRDALGHSVVLSAMTPRGALVLNTLQGTSPIEIGVRPGSELSFHASAQGKILLAFLPRPQQQRLLARPLERLTPHTIVDPKRIEEEILHAITAGFAAAPEEAMLGINAVAAPIFDEKDACVGSVAVVGSIQFLPAAADARTVDAVKAAGQDISRKLGQGRVEPLAQAQHRRRKTS